MSKYVVRVMIEGLPIFLSDSRSDGRRKIIGDRAPLSSRTICDFHCRIDSDNAEAENRRTP